MSDYESSGSTGGRRKRRHSFDNDSDEEESWRHKRVETTPATPIPPIDDKVPGKVYLDQPLSAAPEVRGESRDMSVKRGGYRRGGYGPRQPYVQTFVPLAPGQQLPPGAQPVYLPVPGMGGIASVGPPPAAVAPGMHPSVQMRGPVAVLPGGAVLPSPLSLPVSRPVIRPPIAAAPVSVPPPAPVQHVQPPAKIFINPKFRGNPAAMAAAAAALQPTPVVVASSATGVVPGPYAVAPQPAVPLGVLPVCHLLSVDFASVFLLLCFYDVFLLALLCMLQPGSGRIAPVSNPPVPPRIQGRLSRG